jgi:hypothetical protein
MYSHVSMVEKKVSLRKLHLTQVSDTKISAIIITCQDVSRILGRFFPYQPMVAQEFCAFFFFDVKFV